MLNERTHYYKNFFVTNLCLTKMRFLRSKFHWFTRFVNHEIDRLICDVTRN